VRSGDEIVMEPLVDYEVEGIGDYYLIPKKTKTEVVLDPYIYNAAGRDVLLLSVVTPVVVNDRFLGITGVDMEVSSIQQMAEAVNLYDGAVTAVIISNNGTLAGIKGSPELVGKTIGDVSEDAEGTMAIVQGGQSIISQSGGNLVAFSPIQIGETTTPWSVGLSVPLNVVSAQAIASMWRMIILGLTMMVLTQLVFWFVVSSIVKPIQLLTSGAELLAVGDASMTGISREQQAAIVQREDEIGAIGKSFGNVMSYFSEMAGVAQKLADGDLTVDVQPRSESDVLGHAFKEMINDLRRLIGDLKTNTEGLRNASSQLAEAAEQSGQVSAQITATIQQIAQGISQQSESTNKTAASVEEMNRAIEGVAKGAQEQADAISKASQVTESISQSIQNVASSAYKMTEMAEEASVSSTDGARTVKETIEGMERIRERVAISARAVNEMGERSKQIGAIVETIDEIAGQTNLLSLNASIEAARAGEHGKGFAVVADEVRKLAERSSTATKEINALVKSIQKTVAEAVEAMDASAVEVVEGVERAGNASDALVRIQRAAENVNQQAQETSNSSSQMTDAANDLVGVMDTVSAIVEENTSSTEQMAAGSIEVREAVENIASISEENSASVEEVSAGAEEMSAQAEEVSASAQTLLDMANQLNSLAARFKLD
jgi:methyl-accepting chemotaxis protein